MLRILSVLLVLAAAPAAADMVDNCGQPEDPYLRIGGCSNAIASGNWFGRDLAWAYCNRGTAFSAIGHHRRAIQDYSEAIDRDPRHALAYANRGGAYAAVGDYDLALEDLDRAIEIDASLATAYANRGNARVGLGAFDRAEVDYDLALTLEPELTEALYGRGLMRLHLGQPTEAIADFDAVLAVDPQHTEARWQRAVAYDRLAWHAYKEGRPEEALALVSDALAWLPETSGVIETQAHILAALGRIDEALSAFERAMEAGGADRVRAYEEALAGLGFKPGPSTGVYDAAMRNAMRLCLADGCQLAEK